MSNTSTAPGRVFEHQRLWRLHSSAMLQACDLLATTARQLTTSAHLDEVSAVIGIAHGGTTPARRIAARLGVQAHIIRASHNATDAPYSPATGTVTCDLSSWQPSTPTRLVGTVLVVDDICGTGATFTAVLDALRPRTEPDTRFLTCALCRNHGAPIPPDLYCWDVADWVIFPWEDIPAGHPTTSLPPVKQVIIRD
ncbi:phosphoribosyltransferase [Haloechinothrix salitolerans]|uniref:Phosphoribosyltransferase n=1 Tax=Haloechinothrix salitolerans TaxID=926830 RepID=A0ABW2BX57_9PSEU